MTSPKPDPYADIFLMLAEDGETWHQYISNKLNSATAARTISQSWMLMPKSLELEDVSLACSESSLVVLLATPVMLDRLVDNNYGFATRLQEVPATGKVVVLPLLDSEGKADLTEIINDRSYGYDPSTWTFLDLGGGSVAEVDEVIASMLNMVEECLAAKKRKQKRVGEEEQGGKNASGKGQEREKVGRGEPEEAEETGKETTSGRDRSHKQPRSSPPVAKPRRRQPHSLSECSVLVEFFPATVHECDVDVAMVLNEKVRGEVTLKLDPSDQDVITVERRSAKLFTFIMPQVAPGNYTVQVLVDGSPLPSQHPAQLTVSGGPQWESFTSLHYLMQALGLTTPQELDLKLKEVFNSSLPADGCLRAVFDNLSASSDQTKCHDALYPTILHYAAAHGLSEFCTALLECPGSAQAFNIPNRDGLHPEQLAERSGHHELYRYINDFMDMHTANEIYGRYISMDKLMGEEDNDNDDDDSGSDYEQVPTMPMFRTPQSRKVSDPLPAGVVIQSPTQPKIVTHMDIELDGSPAARLDRPPKPPPRGVCGAQRSSSMRLLPNTDLTSTEGSERTSKTLPRGDKPDAAVFMGMSGPLPVSIEQPLPRAAVGSRSQSELIELNEMVKSKEINLNEAEMLYNAWKVRYGKNSSASFKERQKEITEIKSKYNQIRLDQQKQDAQSKNFLSVFGFHGHKSKQTVKVKITDPVEQRSPRQTGPRVFVKARTASGKPASMSSSERISTSSTTSSSASSRDSGWSQCSRDSTTYNVDQEGDGEVFMQEANDVQRRKKSSSSSMKRLSLGHQYLQEARASIGESSNPTPPPLPPRNNCPPLSKP